MHNNFLMHPKLPSATVSTPDKKKNVRTRVKIPNCWKSNTGWSARGRNSRAHFLACAIRKKGDRDTRQRYKIRTSPENSRNLIWSEATANSTHTQWSTSTRYRKFRRWVHTQSEFLGKKCFSSRGSADSRGIAAQGIIVSHSIAKKMSSFDNKILEFIIHAITE